MRSAARRFNRSTAPSRRSCPTGSQLFATQTFPDGSTRYAEYRIGGTSLASPLMAGVTAIANQAVGGPLGFLNPKLYAAARTPIISDIRPDSTRRAVARVDYVNGVDAADGTTTTLRSIDDEAQSLHVTPGWDNLTGLGIPNGALR